MACVGLWSAPPSTGTGQREHFVSLTGQPEPSALVLNEPSCYHFRVLDPRLPLCRPLAYLHLLGIAADNARPDAA